jgi:hypothetical protein
LPKPSEVGETLAMGEVPVPPSATVSAGFSGSLLVMEMAALSAPATVGVKITTRVQLAPAARLAPQLPVWVKSATLLPPSVMPVIASGAVPLLDKVTACGALAVLSG